MDSALHDIIHINGVILTLDINYLHLKKSIVIVILDTKSKIKDKVKH